jgi:hypothetical protein
MSEGVAWNQGELSEETRRMVLEQAMQTNHTILLSLPQYQFFLLRMNHMTKIVVVHTKLFVFFYILVFSCL